MIRFLLMWILSSLLFGSGLVSAFFAWRKEYRPWLWLLSLGPVGTVMMLMKPPLSQAATPEMREAWEERADRTGGMLSVITLFLMTAVVAMGIVLIGLDISVSMVPRAPRMVLSAASVEGVTVKMEKSGYGSVNSSITPFTEKDLTGTRYINTWLGRSGVKAGESVVEIIDGKLRVDGYEFGSVAKGDTVEIAGDSVQVNGKTRPGVPISPAK